MGIFRTNDPTQFDDVDGIIIDETSPAPSIRGVAANIAILVGQFERGPEELTRVGSIGVFHELYGKSSFSGNKQLANKKFGRLKIIRALAAAAKKASITINGGVGVAKETYTIQAVADVSDSLNSTFFLFDTIDTLGVVTKRYLYLDINGAGVDPNIAGRTGSTVAAATNATAAVISAAIQLVLDALPDIGAAVTTDIVTVTAIFDGQVSDIVDGSATTGFIFNVTQQGDGIDLLTFTAKDKGVYGNSLTVEVLDGTAQGRKYIVKDTNVNNVLGREIFDNIIITDPDILKKFVDSQLIDLTVIATTQEPTVVAAANMAAGSDGTIADTDYEAAIAKAGVEGAGNFLFLDIYNEARNTFLKVHAAATTDKMVIICGAENDDKATVVADVVGNRDADGRIIYAFPYIQTRINGLLEFTSPAAWYASILSNTSPHLDPAFAENTQFLAGVTALKFPSLTRDDYIELMEAGISAFELDADIGFKIKSGVVTQIVNSAKIMVFRRRMADFLTDSIAKFLKAFQNGVNALEKRDEVNASILNFIQLAETARLLPRDSEVIGGKAKLVDTDSLNTDDSVAKGFFKILYRQRIFSSMRFIVLQAEIGESVVVTEA